MYVVGHVVTTDGRGLPVAPGVPVGPAGTGMFSVSQRTNVGTEHLGVKTNMYSQPGNIGALCRDSATRRCRQHASRYAIPQNACLQVATDNSWAIKYFDI